MAAIVSVAATSTAAFHLKHSPFLAPRPTSLPTPALLLFPSVLNFVRKKPNFTVCFVLDNDKLSGDTGSLATRDAPKKHIGGDAEEEKDLRISTAARLAEKVARKKSERSTYLAAAVMSSLGITTMAAFAVYGRFSWQMEVNLFCLCFFFFFFLFFVEKNGSYKFGAVSEYVNSSTKFGQKYKTATPKLHTFTWGWSYFVVICID